MSRGPGRIERAIRHLFDAHPDEAFTTDDLCIACYPEQPYLERAQRVAVIRAADKGLAKDPDWRRSVCSARGGMVVFFNAASLPSRAMANRLELCGCAVDRHWLAEQTQAVLA